MALRSLQAISVSVAVALLALSSGPAMAQGGAARADRAERLRAMGRAWLAAGDLGSAAGYFRDAIRVHPTDPASYVRLGEIYLERDDPAEAIEVLEAGLEQRPGHAAIVRHLAEALERSGDRQAAAEALRDLLERRPGDVRAHLARARLARERGAWSEALASYRALIDLAARGGPVPQDVLAKAREDAAGLRVLVGGVDPARGGRCDAGAADDDAPTAVRRALACD